MSQRANEAELLQQLQEANEDALQGQLTEALASDDVDTEMVERITAANPQLTKNLFLQALKDDANMVARIAASSPQTTKDLFLQALKDGDAEMVQLLMNRTDLELASYLYYGKPEEPALDGKPLVFHAIGQGHDVAMLALLLAHHATPHTPHEATSPLWIAAATGHTAAITWLSETLSKPQWELQREHRCGEQQTTPVLVALEKGHEAAAAILLDGGAMPTACNTEGADALCHAAYGGSSRTMLQRLVEQKASVNHRAGNSRGYTPLMFAAQTGQTEAVKWLLENNADVDAVCHTKHSSRRNVISFACESNITTVKQLTEAKANLDLKTHGQHYFNTACKIGTDNPDMLNSLLRMKAGQIEPSSGLSPLQLAALAHKPQTVLYLLLHHANPHRKFSHWTALTFAAYGSCPAPHQQQAVITLLRLFQCHEKHNMGTEDKLHSTQKIVYPDGGDYRRTKYTPTLCADKFTRLKRHLKKADATIRAVSNAAYDKNLFELTTRLAELSKLTQVDCSGLVLYFMARYRFPEEALQAHVNQDSLDLSLLYERWAASYNPFYERTRRLFRLQKEFLAAKGEHQQEGIELSVFRMGDRAGGSGGNKEAITP
jgi:ankyrin repeat protein